MGTSPPTSPFLPSREAGTRDTSQWSPGAPHAPPQGAAARTTGPARPPPLPPRLPHSGTRAPLQGEGSLEQPFPPRARGEAGSSNGGPGRKRLASTSTTETTGNPPLAGAEAAGASAAPQAAARRASPAPSARARRGAGGFPRCYPLPPAAAFERAARAAMAEPPARHAAGRSRKRPPRRAAGSGHRRGGRGRWDPWWHRPLPRRTAATGLPGGAAQPPGWRGRRCFRQVALGAGEAVARARAWALRGRERPGPAAGSRWLCARGRGLCRCRNPCGCRSPRLGGPGQGVWSSQFSPFPVSSSGGRVPAAPGRAVGRGTARQGPARPGGASGATQWRCLVVVISCPFPPESVVLGCPTRTSGSQGCPLLLMLEVLKVVPFPFRQWFSDVLLMFVVLKALPFPSR